MINILCLFCHPRHTVREVPALSHHVEQVVQLVEDGVGKDDEVAAGPHLPLPEAMRGSRVTRGVDRPASSSSRS